MKICSQNSRPIFLNDFFDNILLSLLLKATARRIRIQQYIYFKGPGKYIESWYTAFKNYGENVRFRYE